MVNAENTRMDNPPIKNWMKSGYDPFEGKSSFKECGVCKEAVAEIQFTETTHEEVSSSICNNCVQRMKGNRALLTKFIEWSRTTTSYKGISNLSSFYASPYSAPKIEKLVLYAIAHQAERKNLYKELLKVTGDSGDQLLLAECLEELSNLQDTNNGKKTEDTKEG